MSPLYDYQVFILDRFGISFHKGVPAGECVVSLYAVNDDLYKKIKQWFKEKLKHIWTYRSRTWAGKALDQWCDLARSLKIRSVNTFVKMLERHRYGIINYCDYPIHTGILEGVNNKIKVLKRKAYGFHDLRYFTLKIYRAFYN